MGLHRLQRVEFVVELAWQQRQHLLQRLGRHPLRLVAPTEEGEGEEADATDHHIAHDAAGQTQGGPVAHGHGGDHQVPAAAVVGEDPHAAAHHRVISDGDEAGVVGLHLPGHYDLDSAVQPRGFRLLHKIPIVKSIYSSVKQVSDTLFSSSGNAFREAVLVQYPRQGVWTVAFVTGKPGGEVAEQLEGDWVSVYVPTTPNPTSGFFLIMRRDEIRPLSMSVDQALKYVISMGVVAPSSNGDARPSRLPAPDTAVPESEAARNRIG